MNVEIVQGSLFSSEGSSYPFQGSKEKEYGGKRIV